MESEFSLESPLFCLLLRLFDHETRIFIYAWWLNVLVMRDSLLTCLSRKNKNFVDEAPAFNDMSVESNNFVVDN